MSQSNNNDVSCKTEVKEDEQCGCVCVYGRSKSKKWNCGLFQSLATSRCTLVLFCLANMFHQLIMSGLLSVVISTLEKRFELQSMESGLIASSLEIASVFALIVISFMGENVNKPAWIGWGVFISGLGSVLFSLPHFIAPKYTYEQIETFNFCGNVTASDCAQSSMRNYRFMFIAAMIVFGFGVCPVMIHGITYLDENVKKELSSLYNGIYYACGGLGPALGYLCGGAMLEIYTDISADTDDIFINSGSSLWVGAWWLGFLITGIVLLIGAIPLLMLPKYLPGTEKHRMNRNDEVQKDMLEKHQRANDVTHNGLSKKWSAFVLVMKNKPFVYLTIGSTVNCAFIYGFNTFGAKYMESVFGINAVHAALLYGCAAIFASAGGHILGGVVVSRFALSVRGILRLMIWFGVISALCALGFFIHCPDTNFSGGTVPYVNDSLRFTPFSPCNDNCGCTTDRYDPVCGSDGLTYFSPCYAGCSTKINETMYSDCSCVLPSDNSSLIGVAFAQSCDTNACNLLIPAILILFLCFITSIITYPMTTQVTLRCVTFDNRTLALGVQRVITQVLGIIPGRILMGLVLDLACVTWSTECGERGSCKIYKRWDLAKNTTLFLFAQTVVCVFFYVLVFLTYHPPSPSMTEKDEKNEEEVQNNHEHHADCANGDSRLLSTTADDNQTV